MIYSWKKIVLTGMPLLLIAVVFEILAGQILQGNEKVLTQTLPIFLISIPVINSVSGNIGSVLGARLASGLHVGYINSSFRDKEMHQNLVVSLLIGFITYFILAIVIYLVALLVNFAEDIALVEFVSVLIVTGVLLVSIVSIVSVLTAILSFKKGLDPDDMIAPVVTTVGDIMGIVFLFIILGIFGVGV